MRPHALETRSSCKDFVAKKVCDHQGKTKIIIIEATLLASASSLYARQLNIHPKIIFFKKKGIGECDMRKEGQLIHYTKPNPIFRTITSVCKMPKSIKSPLPVGSMLQLQCHFFFQLKFQGPLVKWWARAISWTRITLFALGISKGRTQFSSSVRLCNLQLVPCVAPTVSSFKHHVDQPDDRATQKNDPKKRHSVSTTNPQKRGNSIAKRNLISKEEH